MPITYKTEGNFLVFHVPNRLKNESPTLGWINPTNLQQFLRHPLLKRHKWYNIFLHVTLTLIDVDETTGWNTIAKFIHAIQGKSPLNYWSEKWTGLTLQYNFQGQSPVKSATRRDVAWDGYKMAMVACPITWKGKLSSKSLNPGYPARYWGTVKWDEQWVKYPIRNRNCTWILFSSYSYKMGKICAYNR